MDEFEKKADNINGLPADGGAEARPPVFTQQASGAPYGGDTRWNPQNPYSYQNFSAYESVRNPKKKRKGLIVLGIFAAAVFLLGAGALAGTAVLNYYYPNQQLPFISGADDTRPAQTETAAPPEIASSGMKIELKDAPSDANNDGQELTVAQIAKKVRPSVVGIVTESLSAYGSSGTGSGIVMTDDGYIITNNHVISGGDKITIVMDNGDDYSATVVGSDEKTDIAIVKIEARGLTAAEFGDSDKLEVGDLAVAIGNPMGIELQGTVTAGIISALDREITVENRVMTLIQTDASINPGNSGGPLVNKYGQVVGINSIKIGLDSNYEGLGFAIPTKTISEISGDLLKYGYVPGRPAIGITGRSLNERAAKYYNVPQGVLVDTVDQKSDAYSSGLKVGDIITKANGTVITDMQGLSKVKEAMKAGDTMTVEVYREGKTMTLSFKLIDEVVLTSSSGSSGSQRTWPPTVLP